MVLCDHFLMGPGDSEKAGLQGQRMVTSQRGQPSRGTDLPPCYKGSQFLLPQAPPPTTFSEISLLLSAKINLLAKN